ncbi:pilus assembly protein CpaF [Aliidiomarina taiwanensis]|uniref:Pilus assembly protein CpaF n=1 Tax=Aliidiomarina taiwanensis TaxID=946228 RepID=A0A432X913_9GAMM|nr:CpaF family protein [Aliidiomarina taiwanensis]RUO43915.1 pilus assembly protein CpaF [Aliidiomarina taiwanensis]
MDVFQQLKQQALGLLDVHRAKIDHLSDAEVREYLAGIIRHAAEQVPAYHAEPQQEQLIAQVLDDLLGLGPLEVLLRDAGISEIMVNRFDTVFIERAGQLTRSSVTFADEASVRRTIERIVTPLGRRIDESSPMVDARLACGSRVNAVIPPLAIDGSSITIRKFSQTRLRLNDLVQNGSCSEPIAEFLKFAVGLKQNILISGGTGSGKTTLLNVLADAIPTNERIITIEDAAELSLHKDNLVRLESRPANQEGEGQISIRQLVINALRMRPDRIIVGECRGGESLDMLQAMNTGHDGSMTTLHANSPRDALRRLETMVLMAGFELPLLAVRQQIASAVQLIVQITRNAEGQRRITSVCEVQGMEGDVVCLSEIYKWEQQVGRHLACGEVPLFFTGAPDRLRPQLMACLAELT